MSKCRGALVLLILLLSLARLAAAEFEIKDEAEFKKLVPASAKVEKLAGSLGFLEGPVWTPADGGFLIFSDIPADEQKKWTAREGVTTFRKPSHNSNGNILDGQGRLITCEHSGRRVSLTEKDGTVKTVADKFDGKKLSSPNDAVVKSDGTIWFTDPPYGIKAEEREQVANHVFRYDPARQSLKPVASDFDRPNGLCFSPDEKKLYIADSSQLRHIRVFDVQSDGTLANGKIFCKIDKGGPDGIRCDADGRIWSSAGDGVHIFAPDGHLIGKILVPEAPANLCFGGKDGQTLFITARTSLYSIPVSVKGAK
jgi:gluconolactonase